MSFNRLSEAKTLPDCGKERLVELVLAQATINSDVTNNLEAELKLHETEKKFLAVFNCNPNAIVLLSSDLRILETNNAFRQSFFSAEGPAFDLFSQLIPEAYLEKFHTKIERLIQGIQIPVFELELTGHNGIQVPVELSLSSFLHNGEVTILTFIQDISEKKRLERQIFQVVVQIESRERQQLASDLHDNLGPLLSSMNMYLSALLHKKSPNSDADTEMILNIQHILKDAIASVREVSDNLCPQILGAFGLSAAIFAFFSSKMNLIKVEIDDNLGDLRFSQTKETMTYSIIKEAFNNSLKHSGCSEITLRLWMKDDLINVHYSDNGVGFVLNEKGTIEKGNLGLFSITNRIKNMNGEYDIQTSPGKGFTLVFSFPAS